jgi:ribosomal protein S6--L-glutamate ligase
MPGEFRANIHLGGTATVIKATMEEKRIAKAAKAMDLKVAGVDIIFCQRPFARSESSSD